MSTDILSAQYARSAQANAGEAFGRDFVVFLVLMAVPVKNFAFLLPPLFIVWQLLRGNFAFVQRTMFWICLALCVSSVSVLIDSLSGQRVNPPGVLMGVLTYAPLAVMLGLRANFTLDTDTRKLITNAVAWFVIFQSAIGLFQFIAGGESDAVCGTFGLLDFRTREWTIGQVFLTFDLFMMVLFLLTEARSTLTKIAIAAGSVTCAVAHSGHQTLFLMAALGFVAMVQMKPRDILRIGAVLLVLVGLTATISSITWADTEGWYEKTLLDDSSPKKMVTFPAAQIMASPKNLLLGVGMGQYGSRAALITTGEYLSVKLPDWLIGESQYYHDFVVPALEVFDKAGEGSAISKPYYSALNQIVEFGIPMTLLLLATLTVQFFRNQKLSRSPVAHTRIVGLLCNVSLIFFVLCCFIEDYVELPAAVFLPTLLYVAARASVAPENEEHHPQSRPVSRKSTSRSELLHKGRENV